MTNYNRNLFRAPSAKQATRYVKSAVHTHKQSIKAVNLALMAAIHQSIAYSNIQPAQDLVKGITGVMKKHVINYLVDFGDIEQVTEEYGNEGKTRLLPEVQMPKGTKDDLKRADKVASSLPCINEHKKIKRANPNKPLPNSFNSIKRGLDNAVRAMKDVPLETLEDMKNQDVINAFNSYADNIEKGIPLDQVVGISEQEAEELVAQAISRFVDDLLNSKGKRAKDIRASILAQESKRASKVSPKQAIQQDLAV